MLRNLQFAQLESGWLGLLSPLPISLYLKPRAIVNGFKLSSPSKRSTELQVFCPEVMRLGSRGAWTMALSFCAQVLIEPVLQALVVPVHQSAHAREPCRGS